MLKSATGDIPNQDDFYGEGMAVGQHLPDSLKGQLLNVVEMLGLASEQERAVKTQVSRIIYDAFTTAVPLKATTYTEMALRRDKMDAQARLNGALCGERL